jgi:peptidoglycan hydrolase CwlO-like protein
MEFYEWILKHWAEILTALGVGSGGSFAAKKLTDKKQDAKINKLDERVGGMERKLADVEKDIETNTKFDKQFRDQVEGSMQEIKGQLSQILGHLLNTK